jgi:hypothetical protein
LVADGQNPGQRGRRLKVIVVGKMGQQYFANVLGDALGPKNVLTNAQICCSVARLRR